MRYTGSPLEHGSKLFPDTPAYDVKAHLAYVRELHAKYPLNTIEKIDVHISELIAELNPRPYALLAYMYNATIQIYRANNISYGLCPSYEIRSLLEEDVANLGNHSRIAAADAIMKEIWQGVTSFLPERLLDPSEFNRDSSEGTWIHLLSVFNPETVKHIVGAFFGVIGREEIGGRKIFAKTLGTLIENAAKASGHDPEHLDEKKKFIWPSESSQATN